MQAEYLKKQDLVNWDPLRLEYPVRRHHEAGLSSNTLGHQGRTDPHILKDPRKLLHDVTQYERDFNITDDYARSETTMEFGFKTPEAKRFNKHTSCLENQYLYPPSRQIKERVPAQKVHGTTEMRDAYKVPTIEPRLITGKEQFLNIQNMSSNPPPQEPSWQTDLPPLDTTHEGYEKYLYPYLTTSKLHHRPFTVDQLNRPSVAKDIVTFYTFDDSVWTRTPKPKAGEWWLPHKRPRSMYDREKFKQDSREIITHNKPIWVPGTVRDNYTAPDRRIQNYEDVARFYHQKCVAKLPPNNVQEDKIFCQRYSTEYSHIGSGRPLCSELDLFAEKSNQIKNQIKICLFQNRKCTYLQ